MKDQNEGINQHKGFKQFSSLKGKISDKQSQHNLNKRDSKK